MSRPKILVTNDDGITSKGITSLIEVAKLFGDVLVVAPDKPQSATGHSITIHHPLRLNEFHGNDLPAYSCSGTPVDCVKLAIYEILNGKPDLLLSGINHGENTSTNVLYSGTMSAAVEGAMENIPSIGFSLANFSADADFTAAKWAAKKIIEKALNKSIPENTCLNVNVPDISVSEIKGFKIVRQAHAFWADRFDKRMDQFGKPYYWLTGEFSNVDQHEDTDLAAMKDGYVSIVPTHFDMTAYSKIDEIKNWML
ncbi:MAG: 5'/3'-nucleotidase SurE [Bacteroidetes bacterium]|nr:5'/3'-nucleotidase SurE [Bacteroidota bacterium]